MLTGEDRDIFIPGHVSMVHERIKIGYCQNDWQDLRIVWTNWDSTERESFTKRYGDIALLLKLVWMSVCYKRPLSF